LAVLAVDAHQCIGHGAGRIRFEEVAGASIEKGIDGPLDLVVLLKKFIAALLIAGQPLTGFGVMTDDAQVKSVAVEGDAEFRLLTRRSAVVRIDLDEVGADLRALPDCLVKIAVECDRLFGPKRLGRDGAPRLRRRRYQRLRETDVRSDEGKQAEQSRDTKRGDRHQGWDSYRSVGSVTTKNAPGASGSTPRP
jgi:hypothetical protein